MQQDKPEMGPNKYENTRLDVNRYEKPVDNFKRLDDEDTFVQASARKYSPEGGPLTIILQWLSFSFWIGTLLSTSVVLTTILSFYILKDVIDLGYASLYGVAATLVLLPLAIVCDTLYSKYESEKKSTFSTVVTVLHAVGLAMIGVGALIAAVMSIVNLMLDVNETLQNQVTLYGAIFVSIISLIVFYRIIISNKMYMLRRYFTIIMSAVVGIIMIVSIVGPVGDAWMARSDKLIEQNLPSLVTNINSYVDRNKKLPVKLSDVNAKGDTKKLVSDNLVKYNIINKSDDSYGYYEAFYYELCVDYKRDTTDKSDDYSPYIDDQDDYEYSSYISTYRHKAGNVCYKLEASSYSSFNNRTTPTYEYDDTDSVIRM